MKDRENLGEFLSGDRIENSPYEIKMRTDSYCEQVCVVNLDEADKKATKKLAYAIGANYHNNWIVDNLPSASKLEDDKNTYTTYSHGFPIGFKDPKSDDLYLNNHVNIELEYHEVESGAITSTDEEPSYRIVRFTVEPFSVKHEFKNDGDNAKITNPITSCKGGSEHTSYSMIQDHGSQPMSGQVLFTYDVIWKENKEVSWASRWDIYLSMDGAIPDQVHWFSITNSLVVIFVLSGLIALILIKNVKSDYERYSVILDEEEEEDSPEDSGWKLLHADIFRAPNNPMLLAVCCGSGIQILCMFALTLVFAVMGFLNPSRRGSLVMALLLLYVFMGSVAGYVTARLYKTFKGKNYQRTVFVTAFGLPSLAFGVFFVMNFLAVLKGSGDAVPFMRMVELVVIWFGVSSPLVFAGAFIGYKVDAIEFPVRVSSIAREIPDQPWYLGNLSTIAFCGLLPFGACFMELVFVLSSMWMEQYYYIFGFLSLTCAIFLVTAAEGTVLVQYFRLCSENHEWWWPTFINGGAVAFYVFAYSCKYFQELESSHTSTYILYFGYMTVVSVAIFLAAGSVGMLSCLWFNKKIFSAIKCD